MKYEMEDFPEYRRATNAYTLHSLGTCQVVWLPFKIRHAFAEI